jgi:hypothetical protein
VPFSFRKGYAGHISHYVTSQEKCSDQGSKP